METENETPDPNYWHYDAASGEFFKIKGHEHGSVIIENLTYEGRILRERELREGRLTNLFGGVLCLAFCLWLFVLTLSSISGCAAQWNAVGCRNEGEGAAFMLAIFAVAAAGWVACWTRALLTEAARIGPAPRRRPAPNPANPQPHGATEVETIG